ncbi:MAG: GDCCVxC domain-containing (seleno)protein [Gammaproteobacteria bacterium]
MTVGTATVLVCTLTCPQCGAQCSEDMPTNACVRFCECAQCHTLLKPLPGDCCVFCSYGSIPCPPQQQVGACCHA